MILIINSASINMHPALRYDLLFFIYLTLLHISGVVDGAYVSRETPMLMYLNLHAALDQMREKAKKNPGLTGPRVRTVLYLCYPAEMHIYGCFTS